jgi:hypothetical protein
MRWAIIAAILLGAGALAIVLGVIRSPFSSLSNVAHESARYHLKLTGSSIYEYHAQTGQWPTQNGDLSSTSLPTVSPHWRYLLDEGLIVIVWDQTLKADPEDNADRILAYYNKGLISEQGRSWVCWGDLRTEYIKTEDLKTYLSKQKN